MGKACGHCGTWMWFPRSGSAKRVPLDIPATIEGNIHVNPRTKEGTVLAGQALADARADPKRKDHLYRSHFSVCPKADEYRRRADARKAADAQTRMSV